MDFDCKPIIQSDDISTIEEELKVNENLIKMEPSKGIELHEDEGKIYSFNFMNCSEIDFVTNPQ